MYRGDSAARQRAREEVSSRASSCLQQLARRMHQAVDAHRASRVGFLLDLSGRRPVLEINTVPGMSGHGNVATTAAATGMPHAELVSTVLGTAFTKPRYVP
ncbi:hypothetical protein [Streptomyces sp. NPDC020328]